MKHCLSRRRMLSVTASFTAALAAAPLLSATRRAKIRIGACDWSIGKMSDPAGLELARKIGLDGLQVSLGTLADNMKLRQRDLQRTYLAQAQEQGVQIASLAIGEMNNIPYKSDPRTEEWVSDSIDVCQALGCKVVLLAFFGNGDLKGDKPGMQEVIRRLRKVARKAERAGVILGVESWLSADEHMEILQGVGSPAVQVYYDVANSQKMGYDIYQEIRRLGRKHICELHMKENASLLGEGVVDFKRVAEALDEIQYTGWVQIEGAVPAGQPMFESYRKNCAFLRRTFGA